MILGQETKGWGSTSGFSRCAEEGMKRYKSFYVDKSFYNGYKRSVFWKGFIFFKREIEKQHKGKEVTFIWNNISKIGRPNAKTGVSQNIRNVERNYFPVLKEEIKIINPDVVIFLTGPNRDHDIEFHFSDYKITHSGTSSTQRELAFVNATNLPSVSLRMYHPSYFKGFNKKLKANALELLTKKS